MRFDRGLRSVMMKPYPLGFMAVPWDERSRDLACRTGFTLGD